MLFLKINIDILYLIRVNVSLFSGVLIWQAHEIELLNDHVQVVIRVELTEQAQQRKRIKFKQRVKHFTSQHPCIYTTYQTVIHVTIHIKTFIVVYIKTQFLPVQTQINVP
jgi:hypothetical protein